MEADMAGETDAQALRDEAPLMRTPVAGKCTKCGRPLRSSRERTEQTCAYHLDVFRPRT